MTKKIEPLLWDSDHPLSVEEVQAMLNRTQYAREIRRASKEGTVYFTHDQRMMLSEKGADLEFTRRMKQLVKDFPQEDA